MVSKDLNRLGNRAKKFGSKVNVFSEFDRERAERENKRRIVARQAKKNMDSAVTERSEAIIDKNFRVGDPVTNGKVTGKITFIDPKRKSVNVDTGVRVVSLSPAVLTHMNKK